MGALEDACWLGTQTVSPHATAAQHAPSCIYPPCPSVRSEAHLSSSTSHHLKLHFPLIFNDISMGALEDACWLGIQTVSPHITTAQHTNICIYLPCPPVKSEAHLSTSTSHHLKLQFPLIINDISMGAPRDSCLVPRRFRHMLLLHSMHLHAHIYHVHQSDLRHTSPPPRHTTSNFTSP